MNTVYAEHYACISPTTASAMNTGHAGLIKEADLTKMCTCACHDGMYQFIRNTIVVVNQSQRNNPYEFTHESDI